jgi:hypothetical protein
MEYSIVIKDAHPFSSSQVTKIINELLQDDIVSSVVEIVVEVTETIQYEVVTSETIDEDKLFVVHFSHINHHLKKLFKRIIIEGYAYIAVDECDTILGTSVEHRWKLALCRFKKSKMICCWQSRRMNIYKKGPPKPLWKQYVESQRNKGDTRSKNKILQEGFDKYNKEYDEVETKYNQLNECYEELLKEREGVPQ